MALRVWLPLNGNLNNQGLSSIVPSGTPTFLDDGKMGKCISLTPRVSFTGLPRLDNFTILFWLKVDSCSSDWADSLSFTSKQADGSSASPFRFEATKTSRACSFHNNTPYAITQGSRILITNEQKGEWHHCGFSYDGEHCYTYVDGKLIYTDTGLGGYLIDYFHIGETNYMVGGMNDLRIYDECLSQKQIKEISKGLVAHYKLDGPKANENLILRSDKITSGGQASGITRTYMDDGTLKVVSTSGNGNYCSVGFAENSNTNVGNKLSVGDTYTISCDIKVEEGTAFPTLFINSGNGYRQLGGPSLKLNTWQRVYYTNTWNEPGTSYGNISLHLGFSSAIGTYYFKNFKLEKGNFTLWIPAPTDPKYTAFGYDKVWTDEDAGYGYKGKQSGTLSFNPDSPKYSGSTKFDSGYLHYLPSPINTSTDAFTFTCWFYPTRNATMALYNDRTAVGDGFSVFYLSGGIRFDTGSSAQYQSGSITVNAWNFVACTFDKINNLKKTYINGVQAGSTSTIGSLAAVGANASIGNSSTNGAAGAGNQVYGSLSDVRIYATALSADDILTIYKNSGIIDNKGNVYAYEFKEE